MVRPQPKRPIPTYTPAPGSWSTGGVEVANPMSIYAKYKAQRSLFMAEDLGPEWVEITTDKGVKGFGFGGPGAAYVVEKHFPKLLLGEDPFKVEQLWDILWRSTMYYGRKGLVVHAISAVVLICAIVVHIYAAFWVKGSIAAMTRGTVTPGWAWKHHRAWFREKIHATHSRTRSD